MKKLIVALLLAISGHALAEKIDILEAAYNGRTPSVFARFEANKDLGRAWVNVNVNNSDGDSSIGDDTYLPKVEGLSYDAATKTIVLERDGQLIECARWVRSGLFGAASGFKNSRCSFSHRFVKRAVDDGYYIRQQTRVIVSLDIKE